MREIKFRAWDKYKKRMVNLKEEMLSKMYDGVRVDFSNRHIKEVQKNFILMQYTGLKDKQGKEIYEGDIIKLYPLRKTEPICHVQIKFSEAQFNMYSLDGEQRYVRELYEQTLCKKVEVIGDIYRNPELLKGDDK